MAFKYDPKASNCLEKGNYDAELASVEEKVSNKGSQMLEVAWSVASPDGERRRLKDYIVAATVFKLKGVAMAWGMIQDFEEQRFDLAEHIGKQIVLRLDIQSRVGFGDSNTIVGYLPASGNVLPPAPVTQPSQQTAPVEEPGGFIPF